MTNTRRSRVESATIVGGMYVQDGDLMFINEEGAVIKITDSRGLDETSSSHPVLRIDSIKSDLAEVLELLKPHEDQ